MFKKIFMMAVLALLVSVLAFGTANLTLAKGGNPGNAAGQAGSGYAGLAVLQSTTPADLDAQESAALLYMREEEKLAHDLYVTFASKWDLPIFQNISQAEQTHMDAVKVLIDRYGLSDPASSQLGKFTNPDLQALYNELVVQGDKSLADALKAGALVEETDIRDLQTRLAQTDNADIQQVFGNLLNASSHHLRAFTTMLSTQAGETYQPQVLSAAAYQTALSQGMGHGGNGANGGNGMRGYASGTCDGSGRRGGRP